VRLKQRTLELTPRNWGRSLQACIAQVNAYLYCVDADSCA
jgi:hypothetical protein